MNPIIVPDLLTLLTLGFQYPQGFAIPRLKSRAPFCLVTLSCSDVHLRMFRDAASSGHEAERVIVLYQNPSVLVNAYADRPGVMCACGTAVQRHPGGELCRT